MNMKTNKFSFGRFWTLLCQHFSANMKSNLLILGGTLLACVVVILIKTLSGTVSPWMERIPMKIDPTVFLVSDAMIYASNISGIVTLVFVSYVFINIGKRSGEIHYLTLPATNGEKWLSRVVYVIVVASLIQLMYYLSILICAGIGCLFDVEGLRRVGVLLFDPTYGGFYNYMQRAVYRWTSYANPVFSLSVFLLGGTVFRNVPWLKTALILFGGMLAVTIPLTIEIGRYVASHPDFSERIKTQAENGNPFFILEWIGPYMPYVLAAMAVLSIVFVWLSYRLFCRRQLVHKKIKFIR